MADALEAAAEAVGALGVACVVPAGKRKRLLQRDGYVQAFLHPEVVAAIAGGINGKIAVSYVEWAGPRSQTLVMPWRLVEDRGSAEAVAAELKQAQSPRIRGTSISGALVFASALFEENGIPHVRMTKRVGFA